MASPGKQVVVDSQASVSSMVYENDSDFLCPLAPVKWGRVERILQNTNSHVRDSFPLL